MIRALLIDDELHARDGLRFQLQRESDISVVAEAIDGPKAVDAIIRLRPDLVFLDIQIPGFDGLEVIRRVSPIHLPLVVFVTAYNDYAVRAFEARAVDYLVKPIRADRFHEAIKRVRQLLTTAQSQKDFHERLLSLIQSREPLPATPASTYYRRFTVREGRRFVIINAADVDWFEAASNYVELHVGGREHLLRVPLSDLEKKLDPVRFVRIHRSTIVNLERIAQIQPTQNGDFNVVLTDGTALRLSRVFRDRVMVSK